MKIKLTSKPVLPRGLFQLCQSWQKHPPAFSFPVSAFSRMSLLTPCSALSPSDHIRGVFAFTEAGRQGLFLQNPSQRCLEGVHALLPAQEGFAGGEFTFLRDQPLCEQCPFQGVQFTSCNLGSPKLLECLRIMSTLIKTSLFLEICLRE